MVASSRARLRFLLLPLVAGALGPTSRAQWVEFLDETATRLAAPAGLGASDPDEKSYAWGDFDHDGDVDLAVARKQGWTATGKRPNVLLMNQNGVLTDRTHDYASAADVAGDMGFETPTNDRHILAVDIDLDGWLDLVTAPDASPGEPKPIGHPRVYHNRGCSAPCNGSADWLGFRFENARIPTLLSSSGQSGFNPCFTHVAAGDVTGDGYPELWFIDYDQGGACGGAGDFDHKLLLNSGAANPGFFTDATAAVFGGSVAGLQFVTSTGDDASGPFADVNGDLAGDLMKQSQGRVTIAYNDPVPGGFDSFSSPYAQFAYFVNAADLNNDGRIDLIISDDGPDRYLLNQGNGGDDVADFLSFSYSFQHTGGPGPAASDDGFGGNNVAADLNRDGWPDVLVTDVDLVVSGCNRRMHIYRNLGGTPGGNVTLQEQTTGSSCATAQGNPPSCRVAGIPADKLKGVHDVAVFDIDGDERLDLVVGRCNSTEVYINQRLVGAAGGVPDGDVLPGEMLTVTRHHTDLVLNWGDSCYPLDTDYAVYQGTFGATLGGPFTNHAPATCTTLGATSITLAPAPGNTYYLVVPHNGVHEGSYGYASNGAPRQQGSAACLPQLVQPCK